MPINAKGKKILKQMRKTYPAKKAKKIFYAMINEGKITGVEGRTKHKPKKKGK